MKRPWKEEAASDGLSPKAIAQLDKESMTIAGPDFKESFEVYTENAYPAFVTSDSLLNGFHRLLEDSIYELELRRSVRLLAALEESLADLLKLRKEPDLQGVDPIVRQAVLAIGPAMRLLGSSTAFGEAEWETAVGEEVRKIEAAAGVELPRWLEPAEPDFLGIDYRRCRPIGFYLRSPRLMGCYRATRWLQLVPFRIARDPEFGALAQLLDKSSNPQLREFVVQTERVFGQPEQFSLGYIPSLQSTLRDTKEAGAAIVKLRERLLAQPGRDNPFVQDHMRLPGAKPKVTFVTLLSPVILPDAVLIQKLTDRDGDNPWPNGMQIAAWLGSEMAWKQISSDPEAAKIIDESRKSFDTPGDPPSLYYFALRTLVDKPEPDAPPFMKSEAWQRKSLQTVLGGWAQFRHTWELQAKLNVYYFGIAIRPAGFVEPEPGFYAAMGQLTDDWQALFEELKLFQKEPIEETDAMESHLKAIEAALALPNADWRQMKAEDQEKLNTAVKAAQELGFSGEEPLSELPPYRWPSELAVYAETLRSELDQLRALAAVEENALRDRWRKFERTCRSLESMAHKQLRGVEWSEQEEAFLKSYGEHMAAIMGYGGNSWHTPKDEAPRWTTVFHDPRINRQLAVAIGRPRALYVLYPWKGERIFCKGAVVSYYEYPSEQRLSDEEWKAKLDASDPPKQPAWIQPLLQD